MALAAKRLTLEQIEARHLAKLARDRAAMERGLQPLSVEQWRARYGRDPPSHADLDAFWQSRLAADQAARVCPAPPDEYEIYLSSRHWQTTRGTALARAGYACESCGRREYLHVHHVSYDRLWGEFPEDLRVLCPRCHRWEHRYRAPGLASRRRV